MPTLFTRLIPSELPARFVYQDERCVSIAPLQPGHTLVVPREEGGHWTDMDADLAAHLVQVAQRLGTAEILRSVLQ